MLPHRSGEVAERSEVDRAPHRSGIERPENSPVKRFQWFERPENSTVCCFQWFERPENSTVCCFQRERAGRPVEKWPSASRSIGHPIQREQGT